MCDTCTTCLFGVCDTCATFLPGICGTCAAWLPGVCLHDKLETEVWSIIKIKKTQSKNYFQGDSFYYDQAIKFTKNKLVIVS